MEKQTEVNFYLVIVVFSLFACAIIFYNWGASNGFDNCRNSIVSSCKKGLPICDFSEPITCDPTFGYGNNTKNESNCKLLRGE